VGQAQLWGLAKWAIFADWAACKSWPTKEYSRRREEAQWVAVLQEELAFSLCTQKKKTNAENAGLLGFCSPH